MGIIKDSFRPEYGEVVLVKVERTVYPISPNFPNFSDHLRGITYPEPIVNIVTEERYYVGQINNMYIVTSERPRFGIKAEIVREVFEATKKEYSMEEIADSLGIKVEDLRIKKE